MMRWQILPLVWGFFVGLFHLYNFHHPPLSRTLYQKTELQAVDIRGGSFKPWWVLPSVARKEANDSATDRLAEWGQWLRYRLGYRWGTLALTKTDSRLLEFYPRWQFEMQYPEFIAALEKEFLPHLRKALARLKARRVEVVVVPVPTKLAIERPRMRGPLPADTMFEPRKVRGSEDASLLYRYLAAEDSRILNLHDIFQRQSSPRQRLFMPADQHWTSLGITIAAREILAKVHQSHPEIIAPEIRYVRELTGPRSDDHTFGWARRLPSDILSSSAEFKWEEPLYDLGEPKLKFSPHSIRRVVVCGSSYSERLYKVGFNLGQVLQRALDVEVVQAFARESSAGGFRRLIDEHKSLGAGDLLVWEIPVEFATGKRNTAPLVENYLEQLLPNQDML